MTETGIECGHTKTTLQARGVNRSRKMIAFSLLNPLMPGGNKRVTHT